MLSKSKFWTITQREYLYYVKSKGFIISTILTPLFLVAIIVLPTVIAIFSLEKTEMKIAVLDKTKNNIAREVIQKNPNVFFLDNTTEFQLKQKVIDEEIDGFIALDDKVFENNLITVYTKGGGGLGFISIVEKTFGDVIRKNKFLESGIDTSLIKIIDKDIKVETKKVTKEGVQKDYAGFAAAYGYLAGFFIYMLLIGYGAMVMRGVIEEKANRIVEIIASSSKPFDIMFGKILGIGSVALTQIVVWLFLLAIVSIALPSIIPIFISPSTLAGPEITKDLENFPLFEIPPIQPEPIIAMIIYFLLGYFLYSTLFAGLGAAVDQEQDAQTLSTIVYLPLIIPLMFVWTVMANPNGDLSVILSLIPFFSPILMVVRIAATSVPFWQVLLSLILLILTVWASIWVSAKIYRVGILIYGKKPTFSEIFRWLRH
ncbi:MAG: ABC transporter permease [Ignavibacteria bacterium]|nr:ABC transporter permease [Ignavibacteria bacterium]